MLKCKSRVLSLVLCFVMALSLVVPAFAADVNDAMVIIYQDGRQTDADARNSSGTKDILSIGAKDIDTLTVNGVSIASDSFSMAQSSAETRNANGTDASNGTYKVYTVSSNGVKTVRLSWSNLSTTLEVRSTTRAHDAYSVTATASPSSSCTLSGDPAQSVAANGRYSMTFTPMAQLEVKSISFNAGDGMKKDVTVPASGSTTVTVAGQSIRITRSGDSVQVEIPNVTADTVITAQVGNRTAKYQLSVSTDGNCRSDVSSATVEQGASKTVTFTPNSGWNISSITITDGGVSGTLGEKSSSVTVNGKRYSLTRKMDGSAVLFVPGMTADVSVSAQATSNGYYVEVDSGRYTDSSKEGVNFVGVNEPFSVTFEPTRNTAVVGFTVTTASGTYKADSDDNYLVIDGMYYPIYRKWDGDVTINFSSIHGNMKIEAAARDTVHDVDIDTDSRITASIYNTDVDDNDDLSVTFTPKDSSYEIRQIRVTYDGSTYRADPTKESYIRVDGKRWSLNENFDGSVTLYMTDIEYDVDVYASTTRSSSTNTDGEYRISKTTDSHSNITYTGSNPFDYDEDTTVRVYSDNNYIISSVKFTMNGKSATVEPFDTSFKLDGETYYVDWDTNADFEVYFDYLTGDLSINAKSVRGTEKDYNGSSVNKGSYRITKNADTHSTISYTGTAPFRYNESTTVTVKPDKNYKLTSVKFAMDGYTDTIEVNDTTLRLGSSTYGISWYSDGSMSVYFPTLTNNLTVTSKSAKGSANIIVSVNPGNNTQTVQAYHAAYLNGYNDGSFRPNATMTRGEALALLVRLYDGLNDSSVLSYAGYANFADVNANTWTRGYIGYAQYKGYLSVLPLSSGYFQPNKPITRAEFMALLCSFNHVNVTNTSVVPVYTDVASNHWAIKYINYSASMGWMRGYGNGTCGPDNSVTRAQVCALTNRISGRVADTSRAYYSVTFYDVPATFWAFYDIAEASNSHNVTGYSGSQEIWG